MNPSTVLQAFFITCALAILLGNSIPSLRYRFIHYGPRASPSAAKSVSPNNHDKPSAARENSSSLASRFFDAVATVQVPHSWFFHFYIVSVLSSLFWAYQLLTRAAVFSAIASHVQQSEKLSMTTDQVILTWLMMTVQGIRRLYESIAFAGSSLSTMWIAHWIMGILFYTAMSVAVWVEATLLLLMRPLSRHPLILTPSPRTLIGLLLFTVASGIQFDCHRYLASLKKYSLPTQPLFQVLICPHYFAECLIYTSMAVVGAPPGALLNKTIATALFFVVVNLGVTAQTSRQWYMSRFGEASVRHKWNMIPMIF